MGKPDMPLFVLSLVLILLGVLLVYSTSTTVGRRYYDNTDAFLVRQAIAAFLGMALLVGLIFVPHEKIRENTVPIVAGIFVLLVLVLIPGSDGWPTMPDAGSGLGLPDPAIRACQTRCDYLPLDDHDKKRAQESLPF